MRKFRIEILIGILLILFIGGFIGGLSMYGHGNMYKILAASVLAIVVLLMYLYKQARKRKEIVANIPVEDELTLKAKLYAGSKAFMLSLYLWLFIFLFNTAFSKAEEMLGIGILGSALIYAICLWYYKTTGNFNEK